MTNALRGWFDTRNLSYLFEKIVCRNRPKPVAGEDNNWTLCVSTWVPLKPRFSLSHFTSSHARRDCISHGLRPIPSLVSNTNLMCSHGIVHAIMPLAVV